MESSQVRLVIFRNNVHGTIRRRKTLLLILPCLAKTAGPKGFSLSSYGLGASTVEPFLVDEKKITARHIIFWVEKRLAAQGIIPVWKD